MYMRQLAAKAANCAYTRPFAASKRKKMRIVFTIKIILLISVNSIIGQTADTIQFDGFKGVICDSLTTPFGSRKIFPKNRFNPKRSDIEKVESELISQYGKAIKKHHELFYEQGILSYVDTIPYNIDELEEEDKEDLNALIEYKKRGSKSAKSATKRIKKEYGDYDRKYYGYIGVNGNKYIRIEFEPHKEKWVEIPGAGESHIYNLPILVYNLDNDKLSLSGWTGENDK